MSSWPVLSTAVTCTPRAFAICRASAPTPPPPPLINTICPGPLTRASQVLQGDEPGSWDGGGLLEGDVVRFQRQQVLPDGHKLGEGAAVDPLLGGDRLAERRITCAKLVSYVLPTDSTIPAISCAGDRVLRSGEQRLPSGGGYRVVHSRHATHPDGPKRLVRERGLRHRRPAAWRLLGAPDHQEIRTSLGTTAFIVSSSPGAQPD